ncbi:MAG: hypothetical protein IKW88_00065 [Clostridiales bacterium]|nr:hypothetical protein [Clostridiales bacterium]
MKRIRRDNLFNRTASILGNNEGASMVLVAILAIIVLSAVVILRVSTTTFMASSNRQLNQDQAYELAASLGASIDKLVEEDKYSIADVPNDTSIYNQSNFAGLPDSSVEAKVTDIKDASNNVVGKLLTVTGKVGKATYIYTKEYRV